MRNLIVTDDASTLHHMIVRPLFFILWLVIACIYQQYAVVAFICGVFELADQKILRTLNFMTVFFIIFLINPSEYNGELFTYYLLQATITVLGLIIWSGFWLELKARWLSFLEIISSFMLSFIVFTLMSQTYLYVLLAFNLMIVLGKKNTSLVTVGFITILTFLLLGIFDIEYWFMQFVNIPEWFKITLLSFLIMHVLDFPKKFIALGVRINGPGWNIIPTRTES